MSKVEEENFLANAAHAQEGRNSNQERLVELERERREAELYKNPLWLQFWAKRKVQTQKLRGKGAQ